LFGYGLPFWFAAFSGSIVNTIDEGRDTCCDDEMVNEVVVCLWRLLMDVVDVAVRFNF
jgi:hypothetical protein